MSNSSLGSHAPQLPEHQSTLRAWFRSPFLSIPASLLCGYIIAGIVIRTFFLIPSGSPGAAPTVRFPFVSINLIGFTVMGLVVFIWHSILWPQWTSATAKRLTRFSMRSMLILFTLLAVLSATLGVHWYRQEVQRRIVTKFNASAVWNNGQVEQLTFAMPKQAEGPLLDDELENLQKLGKLRNLNLRFVWVTDKGLEHLSELELEELQLGHSFHLEPDTDLQEIFLSSVFNGVDVTTKAGRKSIKQMLASHLTIIRNMQITDAGMEPLSRIQTLKTLSLQNTAVADEGMKHIAKLKQLESLDLSFTYVTNDGVGFIAEMPNLRELDLRNMRHPTDAALAHCAKMPALERLRLSNGVTDKGLKHLANCTNLRFLDLAQSSRITHEAVEELRKQLPGCEIVEKPAR